MGVPGRPPDPGDNRPFVLLTINDVTIKALLDTGASRSYLGPAACTKLSAGAPLKPDRPAPAMIMANGEQQPVTGEVTLPVRIDTHQDQLTFRMAPTLMYEAILGMDAIS